MIRVLVVCGDQSLFEVGTERIKESKRRQRNEIVVGVKHVVRGEILFLIMKICVFVCSWA